MSDDVLVADTQPPVPGQPGQHRRSTGDRVRLVLRGFGQTLITLGLIVLLFVVYEVWITNIFADRNNEHQISVLRHDWEQDTVNSSLPNSGVPSVKVGKGIGILYLPRLGADYHEAIVQGSTVPGDDELEQGAAHYGRTQMPGQIGNFAIAGHRVGKGEPFLNLDHLLSGDAVIVETRSTWYVYRVLGKPANGDPQTVKQTVATRGGSVQLPGREVILPSDGDVLQPVPDHAGTKAATAIMTMTTCTPKFTASHRMIIYAELAEKVPSVGVTMPAKIASLFKQVKI